MSKSLDQRILQLNKRYQEIYWSNEFQKKEKMKYYLNNLIHGRFNQIFEDLKFRHYAIENFTTAANIDTQIGGNNNIKGKKIAVYSCIIGNYDNFIDPIIVDPEVDYYMFTDQELPTDTIWNKIDVTQLLEYEKYSPILLNRKIKMLPFNYLRAYDYSVYVDGNIEIVTSVLPIIKNMGNAVLGVHYHSARDCIFDEVIAVRHYKRASINENYDKQLYEYEKIGFPRHFGLYENSIIVRKHKDKMLKKIMNDWWNEYNKYPTRDQFSLPFVIWKNHYKNDVYILGNNISKNPRFNRVDKHN